MWFFKQTSTAARTALVYVTVGALTVIWTGVWYVYLHNNPPETTNAYYWCGGLLLTGVTLIVIGFGLGRIGRLARRAETPAAVAPPVVMTPAQNVGAAAVFPPTTASTRAPGIGSRAVKAAGPG